MLRTDVVKGGESVSQRKRVGTGCWEMQRFSERDAVVVLRTDGNHWMAPSPAVLCPATGFSENQFSNHLR